MRLAFTLLKILNWLSLSSSQGSHTLRRPRPARGRLALEVFEERLVPCTIDWTNATSGDWDVTSNWSGNRLPGLQDDVCISSPQDIAVTHANGADVIRSLTTNRALRLTGGVLTLSSPSTVGSLHLAGATLAGRGELTIARDLEWFSGIMTDEGLTRVLGTTTLGTVAAKGLVGRTFVNAGTLTWSDGDLQVSGAARIQNLAAGTFVTQAHATLGVEGLLASFDNAGTFRKLGNNTTTTLGNLTFDNSGTVDVQGGTLTLPGGRSVGRFTVAEGTTLNFAGGEVILEEASTVTGPGTVGFVSGLTNVFGTFTPANVRMDGGRVVFDHEVAFAGGELRAGAMLSGQDVTFTGPVTWSGGIFIGPGRLNINALLRISGGAAKGLDNTTLNLADVTVWTDGPIELSNGSRINNLEGAVFDAQSNARMSGGGVPTPAFDNQGTFLRSTSLDTVSGFEGVLFHNRGSVEVRIGTLDLSGGGTSTGSFDVQAGATLNFGGGLHILTDTTAVTAAGTVRFGGGLTHLIGYYAVDGTTTISGGTAYFYGWASSALVNLSAGALGGSAAFYILDTLNWTGGAMVGPGTTEMYGLTINVSSASTKTLTGGRTLNNPGILTWTGGTVEVKEGSVLNNLEGAVFDAQNQNSFTTDGYPTSAFNNFGLFVKSAGLDTVTTWDGLAFNNYGQVEVRVGTLFLSGGGESTGSFDVPAGTVLVFGGGTHNLYGSTRLTVAGRLTVSSGVAHLVGSLTITGPLLISGGTLNFWRATTAPVVIFSGGAIGGSASFTITQTFTWSGGTMFGPGTTNFNGTAFTINGEATKGLAAGRTLNNRGTATWTLGVLELSDARFVNQAGATFDAQNETIMDSPEGARPGRFINLGRFTRTQGTATFTHFRNFTYVQNRGTMEVRLGTVRFGVSFESFGTVTLASGTLLDFEGTAVATHAGSGISGGGNLTFRGTSDAQLAGTNSITGTSSFLRLGDNGPRVVFQSDFRTGPLTNVGTLTVPSGVTVTVNGDATSSGEIRLEGGGRIVFVGAYRHTDGNLTLDPGSTFSVGGNFTLAGGTVTIPATSTLSVGAAFNQTDGRTQLNGGTLTARTVNILNGLLTAAGVINGNLSNSGRIDIGGLGFGTLVVNGQFAQTTGGILNMKVGGSSPVQFDQLRVRDSATLEGTLTIATSGEFTPSIGQRYDFLTAQVRNGTFRTVNLPPPGEDWQLALAYGATGVSLEVRARP